MVDACFGVPRLAEVYDCLDPDRSDLAPYLDLVGEWCARSVLDLGCGTGTFACLLAERGLEVVAIDPAAASLAVARRKAWAGGVRWLLGNATSLPPLQVDAVAMTANVVQVFLTDEDWAATLGGARSALRPGGRLVLESRDPQRRAWEEWHRDATFTRADVPGVGPVDKWLELTDVADRLVSFKETFVFHHDATTSTMTRRR